MGNDKGSFLIYNDWLILMEDLTNEQVGRIFRGLLRVQNGENNTFENDISAIGKYCLSKISKNNEKYEEICKKRSDIAKKREADRKNKSTQLHTNAHNCAQMHTSVGDTDTDTVINTTNRSINSSSSSRITDLQSEKKKKNTPPTIEEVRDFFFVDLVNEYEEIDINEPDDFFHYNEENNWINNGHVIKNWKIFARNWHRESKRRRGEG